MIVLKQNPYLPILAIQDKRALKWAGGCYLMISSSVDT